MIRMRHRKELEALGPEAVRRKLREGGLLSELIDPAKEWLAEVSQDDAESRSREQISIAREANDAAWAAARAAQKANKIAVAAAVIATISAIASVYPVIFSHLK